MPDFSTTNSSIYIVVNADGSGQPVSLKNQFYLPPAAGLIGAVKQDGVTTAIDPDGTIRVIGGGGTGGVTGLAATPTGQFITGNIRLLAGSERVTLTEDPIGKTITVDVVGGAATGGYVQFTGSAAGGVGQQFSNVNLGFYTNTNNVTLMVNGVALTPVSSFTLAGTILTVSDYLAPNSILQVIAKNTTGSGSAEVIAGLPVNPNAQGLATDLIQVVPDGTQWDVTPAVTVTDGGNF